MSQTITRGIHVLLQEANETVRAVSVADAQHLIENPEYLFVDLRDFRELHRDGMIPGAFSCTRGMLEFWIDPESPYYKPIFGEDRHFVFYCGGGWRSALAARTAMDMGLARVSHLEGGLKAWKEAGGAVTAPPVKGGRQSDVRRV